MPSDPLPLHDQQPRILLQAPNEDPEAIAEIRALLAEMDGHMNEELMENLRIQVERVIAWEDRNASQPS